MQLSGTRSSFESPIQFAQRAHSEMQVSFVTLSMTSVRKWKISLPTHEIEYSGVTD
jgi:hypothetical protein